MNKRRVQKERKITVEFIKNGKIHNRKLVEIFTRKINEKGIEKV